MRCVTARTDYILLAIRMHVALGLGLRRRIVVVTTDSIISVLRYDDTKTCCLAAVRYGVA